MMKKILFIALACCFLSGCFETIRTVSYPQYQLLEVDAAKLRPVDVPELSVSREEFVKLPANQQRDVFAFLSVELAKALKIANERLLGVKDAQEQKKLMIEKTNRELKQKAEQ